MEGASIVYGLAFPSQIFLSIGGGGGGGLERRKGELISPPL